MRTIVSVQLLRAVAALAVALCHFDIVRLWLSGLDGTSPLLHMASGVDLFFVISGFVMVISSGALFGFRNGWLMFLSRRIARIVPPYWLVMSLAIPFMSLPSDWGSLLGSYLFSPFRSAYGSIVPSYGIGWTLNFEMYFYALFAASMFLPRTLAVPTLSAALVVVVAVGWWVKPTFAALVFWSDPIILEFMFGMIMAVLYVRGVRLPVPLRICLVLAGITVIAAVGAPSNTPTGWRFLYWGIPATMIFAGTVIGKEINFGKLRGPVKVLGNASYALYLTHPMMTAVVMLGWPLGLNRYPKLLVLFLAIATVQLISVAMYYAIERRSIQFLQGIFLDQAPVILTESRRQ